MKLKQSGPLAPTNEPWNLIRDAIFDLGLQEQQEGVEIEMESRGTMNEWHDQRDGACHQCLAGSVMSRRLGVNTDASAFPFNFPDDVRDRLCALDDFRNGEIGFAYRELKLELPSSIPERVFIPDYHHGHAAFKASMLKLADQLEAAQPTKTKL